MPLTNSQYDEIMRGYQERQLHNQHLMSKRKSDAYAKVPRFKEMTKRLQEFPCSRQENVWKAIRMH